MRANVVDQSGIRREVYVPTLDWRGSGRYDWKRGFGSPVILEIVRPIDTEPLKKYQV